MEDSLKKLLFQLDENVFVSNTDSISNETTYLNPVIKDMEGTVIISGEWDREDLKNILSELFIPRTSSPL